MRFSSVLLLLSSLSKIYGFGISHGQGGRAVHTDSDMEVWVADTGIIRGLKYKGTQYIDNHSFLAESGSFGSGPKAAQVQAEVKGDTIVMQFTAKDFNLGRFKGYYVFRKGENRLYIGIKPEAVNTEARYIFRLKQSVFSHCINRASDVRNGKPLETGDIVALPDGTTASKFFSSIPHKYNSIYGITGQNPADGIWFSMTQETIEGMSGGPFHRDITCMVDHRTALSAYFYSGHGQSEPPRNQLSWITVTLGEKPQALPDLSFLDDLDIDGLVPRSKRGGVQGHLHGLQPLGKDCSRSDAWYEALKQADLRSLGLPLSKRGTSSHNHHAGPVTTLSKRGTSSHIHHAGSVTTEYTVVLSNAAAQYWSDASDGNIKFEHVLPGTYQQTLYQDQLPVSTISVVVEAGQLVSSGMIVPKQETPIWSVGCHDGRPHGFMNSDMIERAHPQDKRMKWPKTVFAVNDNITEFPMAQMYGINNPTTIEFHLTEEQVKPAKTLMVATCSEYRGGHPIVTINGLKQKDYGMPPKLSAWGKEVIETRTITHGTYYRGTRKYAFAVSGLLKPGLNTILLDADGMGMMKKTFLQPNIVYDSVALL